MWNVHMLLKKEYRMRKSKLLSLWTLSSDDSRVTGLECHPERRTEGSQSKDLLCFFAFALTVALVACGDDSGTSANDDNVSYSSVIQSGDSHEGSSNSKKADPGTESGMTSSSKKDGGSESAMTSSSSSNKALSSSWSSEGTIGSSNSKLSSSSSKGIATNSSSSRNDNQVECREQPSTDAHDRDAESCATHNDKSSSSGKKVESSSSEYVPFDHKKTLAKSSKVGKDAYKQFTDPRNGRSYYYITITSSKTGKSVTVMAENLNIGEMVLGENNQNDDAKIERYCYNNDSTKCDEFGGLYQWAEMMQLPSRCNTESCSDLIQKNHRGICPEGWRLFTWDDYEIVSEYEDKFDDGVKGLRSTYGFRGTNQSGFSLTGAGIRKISGKFGNIEDAFFWYFPEEDEYDVSYYVHTGYVSSTGHFPTKDDGDVKIQGRSVRCVKLE